MQSLTFTPGRAFLSADSTTPPWTVVFEDEGVAGYFYACDRTSTTHDDSILDAMLIYNVAALQKSDEENERPTSERIAAVEWSKDGLRAALYLDGIPQGMYDFGTRAGYCRMNFPNFMGEDGDTWRKSTHAWSEEAIRRFEAEMYGMAESTESNG
jgi:hypothetical protein